MKLTSKLMVDGKHVGYLSDDGGTLFPLLKQLLHTKLYFHTLLDAGYKFYSYDPDTIEDPLGRPIVNLPEMEASEEHKEWFELQQEQALTDRYEDSYCSKYYSFKTQSAIEFRKESSYEINTREELEDYLMSQNEFYKDNLHFLDVRPLNAFVNPEALYSIDEIVSKQNVKFFYNIIQNRHSLGGFSAYSDLVKWLVEKGELKSTNPTPEEFLKAYYAWGVDGIKDTCVERMFKPNVDISFNRTDENIFNVNLLENRTKEYCLVDSSQYLYNGKIKEDIADIIEFKRERIVTPNPGELMLLKRTNTGLYDYKVLECWVSHPEDRMYFKFYTEEGYMYSVKVSLDNFMISSNDNAITVNTNFSIASIVPDIVYSINECNNINEYFINNCIVAKATSMIKSRIKKAPFNSNFDMLVADGVTIPAAAIDTCVMTYRGNKSFVSNSKVLGKDEKKLFCLDAFSLYNQPIPREVKEVLDLKYDSSIKDLIDALNSIDDEELMEKGKSFKGKFKLSDGIELDLMEYYSKILYVQDVIDGLVKIDNFGDGVISDEISSINKVYQIIRTCVYARFGENVDRATVINYLESFESNNIIDIDSSVSVCENGYKGCLKDFVNQRRRRAENSQWLYCTAVYKELSNAPVSEQRDYAMEVITFDSSRANITTRVNLIDAVKNSDMSSLPEEYHELVKTEASYIAANLFFHILAGHIGDKFKTESGDFLVPLSTGIEDMKIKVTVTKELHDRIQNFDVYGNRKIISLDSYCQAERFEHGDYFNFLITNVNVTPWRVTPKKGYKITKYNFFVNYAAQVALDKNSDAWKAKLVEYKAKRDSLYNAGNETFLLPYIDECGNSCIPNAADETIDTINQYLDYRLLEHIHLYMKRWDLYKADGKAKGKVIRSMPLRSDKVFENIAELYDEEVLSEVIYCEKGEIPISGFMANMEPETCTYKVTNAITAKDSCKVTRFNWLNYDFDECTRWESLLRGTYKPSVFYHLAGTILILITGSETVKINLRYASKSSLLNYESKGICYQISEDKFLFKAINGSYVVEVL